MHVTIRFFWCFCLNLTGFEYCTQVSSTKCVFWKSVSPPTGSTCLNFTICGPNTLKPHYFSASPYFSGSLYITHLHWNHHSFVPLKIAGYFSRISVCSSILMIIPKQQEALRGNHWCIKLIMKVGKVWDFIKIMICFKIVKFKQIIFNFVKIVTFGQTICFKIVTFKSFGRK